MRVGLVSLERPIRPVLASAEGQALLQRYLTAVRRLADRSATIVVIPETSFATADATAPALAALARSGRLPLSDGHGRVVAGASSERHDAELVGDLPLHDDRTLYARWGDWFVYVDAALLALALASWLRPRRKRTREAPIAANHPR